MLLLLLLRLVQDSGEGTGKSLAMHRADDELVKTQYPSVWQEQGQHRTARHDTTPQHHGSSSSISVGFLCVFLWVSSTVDGIWMNAQEQTREWSRRGKKAIHLFLMLTSPGTDDDNERLLPCLALRTIFSLPPVVASHLCSVERVFTVFHTHTRDPSCCINLLPACLVISHQLNDDLSTFYKQLTIDERRDRGRDDHRI